ncbi:hypothetical protein GCM10009528_04930 [Kineococcus aurantiacus]
MTGVPSGAVTDSGTPWNARKYREAESSSIRGPGRPGARCGMRGILAGAGVIRRDRVNAPDG